MTRTLTDRQFRLAQAVQDHASANYEQGWDVIVETYTLADIAEVFGQARTEKGAIKKVEAVVRLQREAREGAGWSEAQRELEASYDCGIPTHEHRSAVDGSQCVILRGGKDKPELEPDGSVVKCDYSWDGELLSATRTWPGKVGHAEIAVQWIGDGDAPETYVPGWRGAVVRSDNYCNHDAPEDELCWSNDCRRPACCPF